MSSVDASELVAALEVVWATIQDHHRDVPAVMVTLGAGSLGVPRGSLKLGHFAADRWDQGGATVAELFIGGEGLARGAEAVLATLLHEATHGVAHGRGIQDTSRQGRWHNKRFKALAEELGLVVHEVDGIGWSGTALAADTGAAYAAEVNGLVGAIRTWRHMEGHSPGTSSPGPAPGPGTGTGADAGRRPKNGFVLVCGCRRRIRASAAVVEAGSIICGLCGSTFDATK